MRSYTNSYGYAPDLLAAQSYEAMQLVAQATQSAGSGDRNEITKAMAQIRELDTPIGSTSFGEDRLARRMIPVYALDASGNTIEQ